MCFQQDTHKLMVIDKRVSIHDGVHGTVQQHNALQTHIFVQGGVELGSK
jgi:hypothetical protein